MSAPELMLIKVTDQIRALAPAAMHEHAAAKYIGMNRTSFRSLVFAGMIPCTKHLNGKRRIYLRSDLDRYLESLPRSTMVLRENSPLVALKGAAK
jgi:hypothetical protein